MSRKSKSKTTSTKKLSKQRRKNEKQELQELQALQEEEEIRRSNRPSKAFFDRLILLILRKGYRLTQLVKDKLYDLYVYAYQNGLSPLEIYQLLLESIPQFGDLGDPTVGALYEGDVKGGIFPTVPGYPTVITNGGKKRRTKRRTKRNTKRISKRGGRTNKIPITSASEFYDFINKHFDLPFTKEELERKTMSLKKNIKSIDKKVVDDLKNKYFPKANKLKEKLLPLLKNKKDVSFSKLDKHFTEIEELLKDYSEDLQDKFLNKPSMKGGALRPYTGEERDCPICYGPIRPNEGFIIMHRNGRSHPDPCHNYCIRDSIDSTRNRCPFCREPMTREDLTLPVSIIQRTMRRINEMLGNIREPLMMIIGIIVVAYMVNALDNLGLPIYGLLTFLACILLFLIDLLIMIITVAMLVEGDIYEAEDMPLFGLTKAFCMNFLLE